MTSHVLAVARQEFRIGLRNRWVALAALILLVFALVLGLLGAAPVGEVKAGRLPVAVAGLATLSVYLVPLIALLLSFDAIAGEVDRGTLPLLLANPIRRESVILGKFLGHLAVLALAVVLGYGVAGGAIMAISGAGTDGAADLVRLIATSIALGAAFIAFGYGLSAAARQSGTAAALAIGAWLFVVVLYDLGLLGAIVVGGEDGIGAKALPWLLLANPADAFRIFNLAALDIGTAATGLGGATELLPYPPVVALASIAAWLAVALLAAMALFRRLEP